MDSSTKTVITGLGMVTSLGMDVESSWESILSGRSGIRKVTLFDTSKSDTKIAAEIDSEAIEMSVKDLVTKRNRKQMTRTTRMSAIAANEAIKDSGIDFDTCDKTRVAVIMGVISTSYNDNERAQSESHIIVRSMPNAPSAWISMTYGLEGPNFSVSTACASSSYAIGLGHQMIKSGMVDVVIAGGADSHIDPEHMNGFNQIMALSVRNDTPETACRPFSKTRDGFVMGEGSGIVVLESEQFAKARNAKIYGELAGCAMTSEAADITAPKEDGIGMAATMRKALADANIEGNQIDYINAHGTSTYLNDKYETMAIKQCFGEWAKQIGISSTKSMHGHTIASAGAIEAIITVLSLNKDIMPPTINYDEADPELDLDYVPNKPREKHLRAALSNSFGFGGHNASLVFKKYQ